MSFTTPWGISSPKLFGTGLLMCLVGITGSCLRSTQGEAGHDIAEQKLVFALVEPPFKLIEVGRRRVNLIPKTLVDSFAPLLATDSSKIVPEARAEARPINPIQVCAAHEPGFRESAPLRNAS